MKRHYGEPSARHQQPFGRAERAIEFAELVVDGDPQRLKGAGRRVESGRSLGHRRTYDLGEFEGAADRLAPPGRGDRAGDSTSKTLFAEFADQPSEIALGESCDQIRS